MIELDFINAALPYLLPPLAGALIGYFTNYLAIRMLFRPLRRWRLLGIRVPLTPGIIPARRRELAKRIGKLVGDHLLTREVIHERLQSRPVDDALYRWVAERGGGLLQKEYGPLSTLLPPELRSLLASWGEEGRKPAGLLVNRVLLSDPAGDLLDQCLQRLFKAGLQSEISTLIGPVQKKWLLRRLPRLIDQILRTPRLGRWLEREFDEAGRRLLNLETPLGELLPADLQTAILRELHQELPELLKRFSRLLHDPEIRQRLKNKLHKGIAAYIENLGFWRRLLTSWAISEEEMKSRIDRLVDEVAVDLAASLQQPQWQEKVFNLLAERLASLMALSPAAISGRLSYTRVSRGWDFLRAKLLQRFEPGRWRVRISRLTFDFLAEIETQTVAGLAADLDWEVAPEALAGSCSKALFSWLRRPPINDGLVAAVANAMGRFSTQQPLGRPADFLPGSLQTPLIEAGHRFIKKTLEAELPKLNERFAVKQVVEERINQLPVERVEDLLLGIMREHFTYINLFGALIGALIGVVQVLLFVYGGR